MAYHPLTIVRFSFERFDDRAKHLDLAGYFRHVFLVDFVFVLGHVDFFETFFEHFLA